MLKSKNIDIYKSTDINSIEYKNKIWHAHGNDKKFTAPVVILTNNHKANTFKQTKFLPLKNYTRTNHTNKSFK